MTHAELNLAEVADENGQVKQRYERYLAADGRRWVRHGLFRGYHPTGRLATTGHYEHGVEQGMWYAYHANGQKAAQGEYVGGSERPGSWRYWNAAGVEEPG
jgi:antitoxin component YwqK of YwqJK toxin-antitoxin module